ncbi:MAG: PilZ domain-containing protein [Candidatus Thiodiazotropha sp.]
MEHRCEHRKLIACEITIVDRDLGEIRGRIRNISLSGMLVDVGDSSLHLNKIIYVTFPIEDCGDGNTCQAKAMVVHQQAGCLGLMFSELDAGVRQMLRKKLYGYATLSERAYRVHGYTTSTQEPSRKLSAMY